MGFGKGLVGLGTKPIGGFVDLVSLAFQGIESQVRSPGPWPVTALMNKRLFTLLLLQILLTRLHIYIYPAGWLYFDKAQNAHRTKYIRHPRVLVLNGRVAPYSAVRASGRAFLEHSRTLRKRYKGHRYISHCQEIIVVKRR